VVGPLTTLNQHEKKRRPTFGTYDRDPCWY
jgi:hypothetical protein